MSIGKGNAKRQNLKITKTINTIHSKFVDRVSPSWKLIWHLSAVHSLIWIKFGMLKKNAMTMMIKRLKSKVEVVWRTSIFRNQK